VEVKSPYARPTSFSWSSSVAHEDVSFSSVSSPSWDLPDTNSYRVSMSDQEDTRSVRKVSSHFEYPENRSRGLNVT